MKKEKRRGRRRGLDTSSGKRRRMMRTVGEKKRKAGKGRGVGE